MTSTPSAGTAGLAVRRRRRPRNAELENPTGVAADGAGDFVLADRQLPDPGRRRQHGHVLRPGDDRRRHLHDRRHGTPGTPATAARPPGPRCDTRAGVTFDARGQPGDRRHRQRRVRVVAASTGTFYGQAMTTGRHLHGRRRRHHGYSGDGGPATAAELDDPQAVAVDGAGNLVIADTGNERIRVVAESTGTFYGQAMTAGDIYTVAGAGSSGDSGDRGPATAARLRTGPRRHGRRRGERGDRRHRQRPDPGRRRNHRDVLRPGHDGRGHLRRGRHRPPRVLR